MDELIEYMDYMWIQIEDNVAILGINEQGLEDFDHIETANLPAENLDIGADEVCGELETDQGPLNLYCPAEGTIIEINEAVVQNPDLIIEDPYGDGWLFKVESEDLERLQETSENENE